MDAQALQKKIDDILRSGDDDEIDHELKIFYVTLDVQKGYDVQNSM